MRSFTKTVCSIFLLVFLCGVPICSAQRTIELFQKEGRVISRGSNTNPVGPLKATTYKLEMVKLPKPMDMALGTPPLEEVFRLTIMTSEDLLKDVVRIYLDGSAYPAIQTGKNSVAVVIHARKLWNGIEVALSLAGKKDLADYSVLPEKVFVPPEYATPEEEAATTSPIIKLRRLARSIELRVEFSTGGCFDLSTNLPRYSAIEIEGFEMPRRPFICSGRNFVFGFSPEEFARIPNGANIILVVVGGNDVYKRAVGQLDKRSLQ